MRVWFTAAADDDDDDGATPAPAPAPAGGGWKCERLDAELDEPWRAWLGTGMCGGSAFTGCISANVTTRGGEDTGTGYKHRRSASAGAYRDSKG